MAIRIVIMLVLTCSNAIAAKEAACTNPYRPFQQLSYVQLIAIANACQSKQIALLYYNRAYHKNIIEKAQLLSNLNPALSNKNKKSLISHSLYMVMLEEFAQIRISEQSTRTRLLNDNYLRHDEILELRLKDRNKVADKIEQQILRR